MPRTSLAEIEKRLEMLAMLPQSGGETATMGDFYALDVGWLLVENQRLREVLRSSDWALTYLVHNFVNLDGIPQDMGAKIQRIRVTVAKVLATRRVLAQDLEAEKP